MRVLGLDTATRATTVALLDAASGERTERRDDPPPGARPRHTTRLLALAVAVLDAAGADWDDVDRIAVGTGPGTFTGLRIGVTTARALAAARGCEIVGVSTLHALARGAAPAAAGRGRDVLAVLDARRGEVFVAGWSAQGAASASASARLLPRAMAPDALAAELRDGGGSWLAVGDGAVEFRSILEPAGAAIAADGSELHRVSAIEHCRLATELPPQTSDDIHPEYLRAPDAELTRRTGPRSPA